jgi:hypothetical protein
VTGNSSGLQARMDQLAALARQGLPSMLNEDTGLYAQKAVVTSAGTRPLGTNVLYSAMSAIGLQRDAGVHRPDLQVNRTLDAVYTSAVGNKSPISVLAAATWCLALGEDDRTNGLLAELGQRFEPSASSSMDIGLVLAAAAAAVDMFPKNGAPKIVAAGAIRELQARFSSRAQLFGGTARAFRPRQAFQQRLTTFASQVYPVHGLAEFARATGSDVPHEAVHAADRLVERQGPLGQWWWIYSVRTGEVLEGYPVYSVHQHAMAFMALAPLQRLGLRSYRDPLERGLEWVFGENELGVSLADYERRLVSRCIQPLGGAVDGPMGLARSHWLKVVASSWTSRTKSGARPSPGELEIAPECRPYELGWLLYARFLISGW